MLGWCGPDDTSTGGSCAVPGRSAIAASATARSPTPRATIFQPYGPVWSYEAKRCPDCGGREWLPGLTPPV